MDSIRDRYFSSLTLILFPAFTYSVISINDTAVYPSYFQPVTENQDVLERSVLCRELEIGGLGCIGDITVDKFLVLLNHLGQIAVDDKLWPFLLCYLGLFVS